MNKKECEKIGEGYQSENGYKDLGDYVEAKTVLDVLEHFKLLNKKGKEFHEKYDKLNP